MKNQSGQMLVLAIVVIGLVMINTILIIGGSQVFFKNAIFTIQKDEALNLAEAGVDKAIASLNATAGSYPGEAETILGDGSYSVSITSPNGNTKLIEATGYIPNKASPKIKKTIQITASKGVGTSFSYAVQVGEGGLEMSENSVVNGAIYSNGNIKMSNNTTVTGDVYVAGGTQPSSDQSSDCTDPSCGDFYFGKNIAGGDRLDVAQSFKPGSSNIINKVALKLRKIGTPPDITVRILEDNNGKPDKNNVLTSGTLTANLVTDNYGFIEVSLNSSPSLVADTTYWIVLDTSNNSSNYWSWSQDLLQGYSRGQAKWSSDWQAGNPNWTTISGDLGFKTFMGGVITYIDGANGAHIGGNAYAHNLSDLVVTKGAYYQASQNITAASYHPNSTDPATKTMPISDANITAWKSLAQSAGVYSGNISSCRSTLGPGKYVGNITFTDRCTVTASDPIWITGNLELSNGVTLKLNPSYGASSGVIIVDGTIKLNNISKIIGSGTPGSFLMALSTFDSRVSGIEAINVENSGNEGILYAPVGSVKIENNNHLNELTAWKVELENGVIITYDLGLGSAFFSSGPSGAYSLVKGTYQLK